MAEVLITSGCSFSHKDNPDTWASLLSKSDLRFDEQYHDGYPSIGNELISRKALHRCTEHLDKKITLVVMWSTINRKSFLTDDTVAFSPTAMHELNLSEPRPLIPFVNGIDYNNDLSNPAWCIVNAKTSGVTGHNEWYLNYDTVHQQLELTLWNMLCVQLFCEKHNIEYYFTNITEDFQTQVTALKDNFYAKYLVDQIDWSKDFLNGNNVVSILTNLDKTLYFNDPGDFHPNRDGHQYILDKYLLKLL
jgi:hypothetical protein